MRPTAAPAHITMHVRAAVSVGEPFAPRGDALADPGVARDEIRSFRAGAEPLVLRVADRRSLAGDWFCEADGSQPRHVPPALWYFDVESQPWAAERGWLHAWEECEDARWMLHAATEVRADPRLVVLAACACARACLPRVQEGEQRPLLAIEAAEEWARGTGTRHSAWRTARAAYLAAGGGGREQLDPACLASYQAARMVGGEERWAAQADLHPALSALVAESAGNVVEDPRDLARLVRNHVGTADVLRAAARRRRERIRA